MNKKEKHFFSFWVHFSDRSELEQQKSISDLAKSGVNELLMSGTVTFAKRMCELVKKFDISVQHWEMVLLNNDPKILKEHRSWFTINRNGESSADAPPYVGYYKWLCPNNPEVEDYLLDKVAEYCSETDISGFHLDYIRFSDVILPQKCQKQYGLSQKTEEGQYDYCYCKHCRDKFRQQYGYEQRVEKNCQSDENWEKFRWQSVSELVQKIVEIVHSYNKIISAAVFPTPQIARKLVRQDWPGWDLDRYYPMLYHDFYDKKIEWLSEAVEEIRQETPVPFSGGLYLPSYKADQLETAIRKLYDNNVMDISFFDSHAVDKNKLSIIRKLKNE
jgi:uncharacterized lipoprotein YddW (UPF0748 family)